MKIWLVGIQGPEGGSIEEVCLTKEIAERELFKIRDDLLEIWKIQEEHSEELRKKFCKDEGLEYKPDNMYKRMIKNLKSDDYENWNNYPQDCPFINEVEVIDK